jgi:hypothetical protein
MPLREAAEHLGKLTGQKPHISTLWRWCLKGCKGVVLESIRIGGKRFVTAGSIERFITDSTAAPGEEHPGDGRQGGPGQSAGAASGRGRDRRPVARRPTGESSSKSTTTGRFFRDG